MASQKEVGMTQQSQENPEDNGRRVGTGDPLRAASNGGKHIRRVPVPAAKDSSKKGAAGESAPDRGHAYSLGTSQYTAQHGAPISTAERFSSGVDGRSKPEATSKMALVKEVQVPEWEHVTAMPKRKPVNAQHVKDGSESAAPPPYETRAHGIKSAALAKVETTFPQHLHSNNNSNHNSTFLNRLLPPHKRYFGLSRRTFIIILIAIMLAIVALVAGLAAGLAKSHPASAPALGGGATTGWVTYNPYNPGALGSCGWDANDSDYVTAIGHAFFDGDVNPNNNPLCGRMIRAQYNGKSVDVKVIDSCGACSANDLDMAMGPFHALTGEVTGKISPIVWEFL